VSAWILVVVFIHQEGVHSLSVPFGRQELCEQAAAEWRREDRQMIRLRTIEAKCHATGAK
jgi:hypothetical protein